MSRSRILYIDQGNRRAVQIYELTDKSTGLPINNATCSFRLLDSEGSPVAGVQDPLPLPSVDADGTYRGYLPATTTIPLGDYRGTYTAELAGEQIFFIDRPVCVRRRPPA